MRDIRVLSSEIRDRSSEMSELQIGVRRSEIWRSEIRDWSSEIRVRRLDIWEFGDQRSEFRDVAIGDQSSEIGD